MAPPNTPTRIGPWRLERSLGSGAFGEVYAARDPRGQIAVVKLLQTPPGEEIRALARIHHPAVVRPLGSGGRPRPYVAMEVAPGRELGEEALPAADATRVVAALADALAACHRVGVAHGDVKPANVVYDAATGRVTLVDFGLAGATGGTPRYSPPERFEGGQATPASDVYSLGILACALFDGEVPPRTERTLGEVPRAAPPWVRETVAAMLAADPARRPGATAVADVFDAHGVALPVPSEEDLRRRATVARVPRSAVELAVEDWVENGGRSGIVGPPGSGRSHALAGAAIELQARGRPYVTLRASAAPWASVEEALRSPSLPGLPVALPSGADRDARAEAAAEALNARADAGESGAAANATAVVLVDDFDQLDPETRATVEALGRLGAHLFVTAGPRNGSPPFPFPTRTTTLPPLRPPEVAAVLEAVLGAGSGGLAELVVGSWPGEVIAWVLGAARAGHLRWRRGGWIADVDALVDWRPSPEGELDRGWTDAERRLAGVVAVAQPVELAAALRWADAGPEVARVLVERGILAGDDPLAIASPALVEPLRPLLPRTIVARMVEEWLARPDVPWPRLGPLLVHAADPLLARTHGAETVRSLTTLAPDRAATLADALVAVAGPPTPPRLVAARISALAQSGRLAEVRAAAEAQQADLAPEGPDEVEVLLAIASAAEQGSEDPARLLELLDRAARVAVGADATAVAHARARVLWRAHRYAEADDLCAALDAELTARMSSTGVRLHVLELRGLWAQVRAARDADPRAGLALLADIPATLGAGSAARAVLDAITGRLLWMGGNPRDAAHAFEAAAASRRSLPMIERARLDNNAGLAWHGAGDVERAVETWERSLAGFERVGASLEAVRVGVNLCQGYRELGRWQRAEEVGHPAVTAAEAAGAEDLLAAGLGNLGDVALARRQFGLAEGRYDAAEAVAARSGLSGELVELARRRVELAWFRKSRDLGDRLATALALAERHAVPTEEARILAIRAAARAQASEGGVAEDAEAAVAKVRSLGLAGELAVVRLWLAEAWLAAGDGPRAAEHADFALRFAEEMNRPPLRSWADRVLARARPVVDPARDRLERLTELAVRVSRHAMLEDLLPELVAAAVELIGADRALVVGVDGQSPRVLARAARPGIVADDPPSMSILRQVMSTRREVVIDDVEERGDIRRATSVVSMALRSIYCLPLFGAAANDVVGVLYLDGRQRAGATADTVALLRALAAHASVAMRKARVHAEMVEQAQRLRDIAHDLRSPLTGILLAAGYFEDGGTLEAADVASIRESAEAALRLVQQTLAAEQEEPTLFDLGRSLVEWANAMGPQARAGKVQLALDVDGRRLVRGRRLELRRVFTNLVSNALRHAPEGGCIRIRSVSDVRHHGFEIHDDGPGFPPDALDRVFERGFHRTGGTGLGLAIVRDIVLRHHGEVAASNPPEGGALVRVSLPAHRGQE